MLFSRAMWIHNPGGYRSCEWDRRAELRLSVEYPSVPEHVPVRVTADARYTLFVNGQYVNFGPARGYQKSWPVDELDLAPYLVPGENVLGVLLYQYGLSNYSYSFQGASGFLLEGPETGPVLDTGRAPWSFRAAPGYLCGIGRAAGQYGFQEFFDCRKEDDAWQLPAFRPGAEWVPVSESACRVAGAPPWDDFEQRGIPLLTRHILADPGLRLRGSLVNAPGWETLRPLHELLALAHIQWDGASSGALVYDFEQEAVGHLIIEAECDTDGAAVDFAVFEAWDKGEPRIDKDGYSLYGGRLILARGKNTHTMTLPWGFRSVLLLNRSGAKIGFRLSVRETVYPFEVQSRFASGDERLDSIWQLCLATQRHCMVDGYIDGPWRENAQWWGDALVQARNTFALGTDDRLLIRGERQMGFAEAPQGLTYGVAPGLAPLCVLPDYSAMWLSTLYAHYWQTGSTMLYRELRERADRVVDYFDAMSANGALPFDRRYWLFVDWCPDLDKPEAYNLIVAKGLQDFAALADLEGDADRAGRCRRIIRRITGALEMKDPSPHAVAFAILTGTYPERHRAWFDSRLLPLITGDRKGMKRIPSSYFIHYVFEAAKMMGAEKEVVECIRRWWGEYLDHDEKTVAEKWIDVCAPTTSRCHAWSAHALVHLNEIVLGVRQTAPGWKEVEFSPLPLPGKCVHGSVATPFGVIKVVSDASGAEYRKEIRLPEGITLKKQSAKH